MSQGSPLRTTGALVLRCAGAPRVPAFSGARRSPGCRQEQRPPHSGRLLANVPLYTAAHTSNTGDRTPEQHMAVLESQTPSTPCLPKTQFHLALASSCCSLPNLSLTGLLLVALPWSWPCPLAARGLGEPVLTPTWERPASWGKSLRRRKGIQNTLAGHKHDRSPVPGDNHATQAIA